MNSLPGWVKSFNASGMVNSFFGKSWQRVLPDDAYATLDNDDVPYESNWSTIGKTFPHLIQGEDPAHITKTYYNALRTSPFSLDVLEAFAKAAIEGEHLGEGKFPDLLCIGFSATDEVGHSFGPHSREIVEMAVQTDRVLTDFFKYLDSRLGLKNTIVVLTSDHGVSPIPEYIRAHYPSADVGRLSRSKLMGLCNSSLTAVFGEAGSGKTWIRSILADNIYVDRDVIQAKKVNLENVCSVLADSLMSLHEIALAISRQALLTSSANSPLEPKLLKSFHRNRSGDVVFALKPFFYLDESTVGAEHGYPYDHDAHVPLIIMGEGIRSGTYATECSPVDIGPTLSALLGVEFPAGREGRVLIEAVRLP
jgi:predicted AlkP superfamily pyrophosphatase or phosphodiesterase